MLKKLLFIITAGGFIVMPATGVMAFGIGGYATASGGNSIFSVNRYEIAATSDMRKADNFAIGGGLILDTNLAYNRVFNYRLKLGAERNTVNREAEMKLTRLNMTNIFGFGVVRTNAVRFWFGPEIGTSYTWGKRDEEIRYYGFAPISYTWQRIFLGGYSPLFFMQDILRDRITKITYGGIDLGFVLGLNINIGDHVTIGPELGFKYAFNWGSQKRDIYDWFLPLDAWSATPFNIDDNKESLNIRGFEIYGSIAVMFRVGGDTY